LSEIKVINDENSYYLLSQSIDSQKYEILFLSPNNSFKGLIDFNESKLIDNEWETNDESKQSQTVEALRYGSKLFNKDSNNSYCYRFNITEVDANNGLYRSELILTIYEFDEQIAETPVLSFSISKVDSIDLLVQIMPKLIELIRAKDEMIDKLNSENESLRKTCLEAVESLDYFTIKKEENDSILFTKFVALLNQKKNRIRELEQEINRNN